MTFEMLDKRGPALALAALGAWLAACGDTAELDLQPIADSITESLPGVTPSYDGAIVGFYGKCLTASNGASADGTPVVLSDCRGLPGQRWSMVPGRQIQGIGGKCVAPAGGSSADRTEIVLQTCSGATSENWSKTDAGQLVGLEGKCLNVAWADYANGTGTILWPCQGGENEKWSYESTEYLVGVHVVAVSNDDGSNAPPTTPSQFKATVDEMNKLFLRSRIRLVFSGDPVSPDWTQLRSTTVNKWCRSDTCPDPWPAEIVNTEIARHKGKAVVLLFNGGEGGFGSFPGESLGAVVMQSGSPASKFAHEFSHYFSLRHTFAGFWTGADTMENRRQGLREALRLANGSVAGFDGDGVSDTPPDPNPWPWEAYNVNSCTGSGVVNDSGVKLSFGPDRLEITGVGINGQPYLATFRPDRNNVISYWGGCVSDDQGHRTVTPDQIKLMRESFKHPSRAHLIENMRIAGALDIGASVTPDGRPVFFALTDAGNLAIKWKITQNGADDYTAWKYFGLPKEAAGSTSITAAEVGAGRLQLFVGSPGSRHSYTRWQVNDSDWTAWYSFVTPAPAQDFTATKTTDGRARVYMVGDDGSVHFFERLSTDPNSSWSGWSNISHSVAARAISATRLGMSNRQHIQIAGVDGAVYGRYETPSGTWSDWLGTWTGASPAIDVEQGRTGDGRLQIFIVRSDGIIEEASKLTSDDGSALGKWSQIPAPAGLKKIRAFPYGWRPRLVAIKDGVPFASSWNALAGAWGAWEGF